MPYLKKIYDYYNSELNVIVLEFQWLDFFRFVFVDLMKDLLITEIG